MALIVCPDCRKSVSSVAPSCPCCGRTFKATTIELTEKRWKVMKLFGGPLFCLGFLVLVCGGAATVFPYLLMLAGGSMAMVARIGTWWCNE